MSDAGVVEEWVYQGGTFTSTNSWMQGGSGSGGNMILEWNTDVATTRKQIKQSDRKSGIQISYNDPDNGWTNEQYIGTSYADTDWGNDENWEQIPNQKQISDLKSKFESEYKYTNTDLTQGIFYNLIGTTVGNPSNGDNWWSKIIDIKEGDRIILYNNGGLYGRIYGLTDTDKNIYEVGTNNESYLINPLTTTARKDGYLYVNTYGSEAYNAFSLTIIHTAMDISEIEKIVLEHSDSIFDNEKTISKNSEDMATLILGQNDLAEKTESIRQSLKTQENNKTLTFENLFAGSINARDLGLEANISTTTPNFHYAIIECSQYNTIISVNTKSNTDGKRGLVFIDKNHLVIQVSDTGVINEESISIPSNAAFIGINCIDEYAGDFKIELKGYSLLSISDLESKFETTYEFDNTALTEGIFYDLTKDTVGEPGKNDNVVWAASYFPVKKGDTITLYNNGGPSGRIYGLTDTDKNIYEVGTNKADYTILPLTTTAQKDGYLYVNAYGEDAYNAFSLTIIRAVTGLPEIEKKVSDNSNSISLNAISISKNSGDIKRYYKYQLGINMVGTVKILSVSNSYGCDAMSYMPLIANSKMKLGICYSAGASLSSHWNNKDNNFYKYYYYDTDKTWKSEESVSLTAALSKEDWDYIVFQQSSANSGKIDTYEPYLTELINLAKETCPNAEILFNMTQPYAIGYSSLSAYGTQEDMYNKIKEAMNVVYNNHGIGIIPTGIAVQLARETSLNSYGSYSEGQISSDGTHLDDGIGRLLAAYTWLAFFGITFYDSDFMPSYPLDITIPDGPRSTFENVTEDMADIAKKCAMLAELY